MQGYCLNWVYRQRLPHDETSVKLRKDNRGFLYSSQDKNSQQYVIYRIYRKSRNIKVMF